MTTVASSIPAAMPADGLTLAEAAPEVAVAGPGGTSAPESGVVCSIDEEICADGEAPALQEAGTRGWSIGSRLRMPSIFHRRTRDSRSMRSQEVEESDDEEYEVEKEPWCNFMRQHCGKGKGGCCYWCYVFVFFSFVFFFALFLKFMMTAPMPPENWNMEFERFPALMNQSWVQDAQASKGYSMKMSEIPQTWSGCNHSCSKGWNGMISTEMNFNVEMEFSAPNFEHTAYPVLLASNDFNKWWVASDRRDSTPTPFFSSSNTTEAPVYQYITDNCTRPPFSTEEQQQSNVKPTDSELREDKYASQPVYVMVCVTWRTASVSWHEQEGSEKLDMAQIAEHCDAVGGVAGWPCASNPLGGALGGVTDGVIDIDNGAGTIAGVPVANASFSGKVSLRACLDWPGDAQNKECKTSTTQMSRWPCHKCQYKKTQGANGDIVENALYDSFPRLEVLLQDVSLGGSALGQEAVPRAYVLTSPVAAGADGPDGLYNGTWKKLYQAKPPTLPVGPTPYLPELEEEEEVDPADYTTTTAAHPVAVNSARFKMQFYNKNSLTLKPDLCFAARGALYLVACAVNTSTYADGFNFLEGQPVAGPPFNDRCMAVTGRCAYACMEQQSPRLDKCEWDGTILQKELLDSPEEFLPPVNDGGAVNMFMFVLLLGFAVKLVTYFPGLFIPYKHSKTYSAEMTDELKYIAVCCPSGGETKATVMRNLVGAISGMPKHCRSHFHIVFADEGHRHPQKIMFRKLVEVMEKVPDVSMTGSSGRRSPRRSRHGYKAENLKAFTKLWTEQTRQTTLEGCNTDKIAKKAANLRKEDAEGNKREIETLEAKLDRLAGLEALRTLQARNGWPKGSDLGVDGHREAAELEAALQALRAELAVGEKQVACKVMGMEAPRPMHMDDVECYKGQLRSAPDSDEGAGLLQSAPKPIYTMHYLARAKPDEDERTLKVQHVARGVWYYKIPQVDESRSQKSWLEWRQSAQEFVDGDTDNRKYIVPLRTSRGKAGGLNFVENYLFDYSCRQEVDEAAAGSQAPDGEEPEERFKYSLFAIADARHQFQPDFMQETIPFFFLKKSNKVNPRVAFTQCPQYFPEMPDEVDYLDTNNSNFFRMNCMLRNCCGGVSSCGTGGTWLIRDRRAGIKGTSSIWEMDSVEWRREGFSQIFEHRFFHESCKVEDTASSLDRVVKGKHSQYINRRLAYGMAKDPVDYLAAVQRWAEGGVVLSLQTFMGCEQGIHMIWMTFGLFLAFLGSLLNMAYGSYQPLFRAISEGLLGDESLLTFYEDLAGAQADLCVYHEFAVPFARQQWVRIFLEVELWLTLIFACVMLITLVTTISYMLHHTTCGGRKRKQRRTRFPISLAQWARLAITMDNLTYFLWFWTAFFWVFFNYYTVFFPKTYVFEPQGMMVFSWIVQALSWAMVISATMRYRMDQSMAANEVFFLSLTNIWRTTQLFYITAPLTLYSILMGISDFLKNRMLGVDISYWVGGDRGAVSKGITQYWTLLLVTGGVVTNVLFWAGLTPHAEFINILIVTFIALDVLHPCCFLWLGNVPEKLPKAPERKEPPLKIIGADLWQCAKRSCQLMACPAFYRNSVRAFVFHRRTSFFIRWIGPVQNVMFPVLTYFMPELAINQALLLLASVK